MLFLWNEIILYYTDGLEYMKRYRHSMYTWYVLVVILLSIQYALVSRTRLIEIPVNTNIVSIPFKAFLILSDTC